MKKLIFLMVSVLACALGATLNAQEVTITPTVNMNSYTPQKKEKLEEFLLYVSDIKGDDENLSKSVGEVKVIGWVKGKNFMDSTPIQIWNNSVFEKNLLMEGVYCFLDGKSYIKGRIAYGYKDNYEWYKEGVFSIYNQEDKVFYAYARHTAAKIAEKEWAQSNGFPVFSQSNEGRYVTIEQVSLNKQQYRTYDAGDYVKASISTMLPDGSWVTRLLSSDLVRRPYDSIWRKTTTLRFYPGKIDKTTIWNIAFKNGDKYEGALGAGYGCQGKYYFANGDIYEGEIGSRIVQDTFWCGKYNSWTDKMSITFSDGGHVEKGWWKEATKTLKDDEKEKLMKESSSATDLRNRLGEYLTNKELAKLVQEQEELRKKDSMNVARNNRIDKLNKKINNMKIYAQKNFGRGSTIIEGVLVLGMTKAEVDYALKFHVLYRAIKKFNEDLKEYNQLADMHNFDARFAVMDKVFDGDAVSIKNLYKKTYSRKTQSSDIETWKLNSSSSSTYGLMALFGLDMFEAAVLSSVMHDFDVSGEYESLRFENGRLETISSGSGW